MAEQPDKPMDLTNLPLPSKSNVLIETQDTAASTSATPFAEPPTIAAPKSKVQKQREYRQRVAASRTPAQAIAARKLNAERQRNWRRRRAASLALVRGLLGSATASSSRSGARSNHVQAGTQRQLTHRQCQTSAAESAQILVQPGTSFDQIEVQQAQSTRNTKWASSIMRFKIMADRPDDPMYLTDLPRPSRSNVLTEAGDAAASTSATLFAEPPTIAAPKSKVQTQREKRQRVAAFRTPAQEIAARKSDAKRQLNHRLRKAANLALVSGSLVSTTACSSGSGARSNDVQAGTQRQLTHRQRQTSAEEPAITVQPDTSSDQIEVQQAQSTRNTKWASSIMRFKIMADQTDEPMDLMDLPRRSRSNVLKEAGDAAASTSATLFAEPPTIAAPKSKVQKQHEKRQRVAAFRTPAQEIAAGKLDAKRQRNHRLSKAANLALVSGSLVSTIASSSGSWARSNDVQAGNPRQLTHRQRQTSAEEPEITVQPDTSSDQIEVQHAQSTRNTKWASSTIRFKIIADQPDEHIDLTDLPRPSRSNVLTEAGDSAASTSATIAAPKSKVQKQREYRQRVAASRTPAQAIAARKADAERQRNYRLRKTAKLTKKN